MHGKLIRITPDSDAFLVSQELCIVRMNDEPSVYAFLVWHRKQTIFVPMSQHHDAFCTSNSIPYLRISALLRYVHIDIFSRLIKSGENFRCRVVRMDNCHCYQLNLDILIPQYLHVVKRFLAACSMIERLQYLLKDVIW